MESADTFNKFNCHYLTKLFSGFHFAIFLCPHFLCDVLGNGSWSVALLLFDNTIICTIQIHFVPLPKLNNWKYLMVLRIQIFKFLEVWRALHSAPGKMGTYRWRRTSTFTMQMHSGCKVIMFCSIFWICHYCYIVFFNFNMDLSRLIHGFLYFATGIC